MKSVLSDSSWLALMIGNSRLHWAWFIGEKLYLSWDTQHLPASVVQQLAKCKTLDDLLREIMPPNLITKIGIQESSSRLVVLSLASVVPNQTTVRISTR